MGVFYLFIYLLGGGGVPETAVLAALDVSFG